jgi:malic enzyme
LHEGHPTNEPHKRELALPAVALREYGLDPATEHTPLDVIAAVRPTVLIGATGRAGTFTQPMLESMARTAPRPIVLALSNPTSKAECTPEEAIRWTSGRALVATGSPFADVEHAGRHHVIGQANNVFVFPGVGLGAAVAEVEEITNDMFFVAAATLARLVSEERLAQGALYPHQSELRAVSFEIACAVVRYASEHDMGRRIPREQIPDVVRAAVWEPSYVPVRHP